MEFCTPPQWWNIFRIVGYGYWVLGPHPMHWVGTPNPNALGRYTQSQYPIPNKPNYQANKNYLLVGTKKYQILMVCLAPVLVTE